MSYLHPLAGIQLSMNKWDFCVPSLIYISEAILQVFFQDVFNFAFTYIQLWAGFRGVFSVGFEFCLSLYNGHFFEICKPSRKSFLKNPSIVTGQRKPKCNLFDEKNPIFMLKSPLTSLLADFLQFGIILA